MKKVFIAFSVIVVLLVGIIFYAFYTVPLTSQELTVLAMDYLSAFNNSSEFTTDVPLFNFERESIVVTDFMSDFNLDIVEWEKVLTFTENNSIDILDLEDGSYADYVRTEMIDGVNYVTSSVLSSFPTYVIDNNYGLLYELKGIKDYPFGNMEISEGEMSVFGNKYVVPFTAADNSVTGEVEIYLNSFGRVVKIDMSY